MDPLIGLASLAGLSLFLSRVLRRSASLMPLVAVSAAMLWFTLFGMVGLLQLGGWLWYLGCAAATGWVVYKERRAVLRRFTPGLLFFAGVGVFFILLFYFTKPMFTQWDEFTFWSTAGKVTVETNQLYTTAQSNLIARSYPPGLIALGYMMQFFGGAFAEYKFIAAYAVLYLAAFAAASALWNKTRAGAIVALAGLFLLPLIFETGEAGVMSWAYLSTMADAALAALFGGALALWFGGGKKDTRLLVAFGLVLAALTNIKDIGLALACLALLVAGLDAIFCSRDTLSVLGLRGWKALLAGGGACVAFIGASFFGWWLHLQAAANVNRGNVGPGGEQMSMLGMLLNGVKALLRITPDPVFDDRFAKMNEAFFTRRIWIFGSSFRMLLVILAITALAWYLAKDRNARKRVLVFTVAMAVCFVAFHIFNTFTYAYIFSGGESETLKDYARYLYPFWYGWLMTALVLLGAAANRQALAEPDKPVKTGKRRFFPAPALRARLAGAASAVLVVAFAGGLAMRGNYQANFLHISPSLYGKRLDVKQVVTTATEEGMAPGHRVYLISQGDDASRFYMFSYEMQAELAPLYKGADHPTGTTAAALVPPGTEAGYPERVWATPEDLAAYLRLQGCTHLLVDWADDYIVGTFGPLFAGGLEGWRQDGLWQGGRRYYRIEWEGDMPRFVSQEGGAA